MKFRGKFTKNGNLASGVSDLGQRGEGHGPIAPPLNMLVITDIVIQKVYTKSFKLNLFYFVPVKALSAI